MHALETQSQPIAIPGHMTLRPNSNRNSASSMESFVPPHIFAARMNNDLVRRSLVPTGSSILFCVVSSTLNLCEENTKSSSTNPINTQNRCFHGPSTTLIENLRKFVCIEPLCFCKSMNVESMCIHSCLLVSSSLSAVMNGSVKIRLNCDMSSKSPIFCLVSEQQYHLHTVHPCLKGNVE